MLTAEWKATFLVLPRLTHDEKVGDYYFRNDPDGCRVSVAFSNELRLDEHGTLNVDHVEACAQAETHRLRIEELMLIRNVYQQVTCPVEVSLLDEGPQLLNKEDLQCQGIVPKWRVSCSLASAWRIILVGDSITESQTYWQKASQGKMSSHTSDVLRIEKWLQSSEDDDTYGASFVHIWTALNAAWSLYCRIAGCNRDCPVTKRSSKKELNTMACSVGRIISGAAAPELSLDSASVCLISEQWANEASQNKHNGNQLRLAWQSSERDSLRVVGAFLRCAYAFRCQLFHDAPEPKYVARWAPVFSHLLRQVATTCLFNLTQL